MVRRFKRALCLLTAFTMLMTVPAYAEQAVTATAPGRDDSAILKEQGFNSPEQDLHTGPGTVGVFADETNGNGVTVIDGTNGTSQSGSTATTPSGTVQSGTSASGQTSPGSSASGPQSGSTQTTGGVAIDQSIAVPELSSEAAALYDATTGQFLYEKEGQKPMYPASMTKLMTALLTVENVSLDDTVTFTATATQNLESGAATVNLTTGDTLSVRACLYALLLKSACEVANGLAEKVSGSQAAFVDRMNQRAQELGCTNTHFENASGLNGASHYTTARDMALIANAAVSNETIKSILQTKTYKLPSSKNRMALTITNGNKMINSANSQYYEGIVGGKTGYTSKAGNTLAEVCDISGHRLVAVVMKSNGQHYDDVKKLFDYGKALIAAGQTGSSAGTSGTVGGSTSSSGPVSSGNTSGTSQATGDIVPGMTGGPGSAGSTVSGNNSGVTNIGGPTSSGTGSTVTTGFVKTSDGTQYVKSDGSICKNEWLDLLGKSYFFDGDGYMVTGWVHFSNGDYYYFNPETGEMITNKWVTEDGKSYYLGSDGVMATNTIIDGTYRVDENGQYVEKVA